MDMSQLPIFGSLPTLALWHLGGGGPREFSQESYHSWLLHIEADEQVFPRGLKTASLCWVLPATSPRACFFPLGGGGRPRGGRARRGG